VSNHPVAPDGLERRASRNLLVKYLTPMLRRLKRLGITLSVRLTLRFLPRRSGRPDSISGSENADRETAISGVLVSWIGVGFYTE
jgi:hypothetical protein